MPSFACVHSSQADSSSHLIPLPQLLLPPPCFVPSDRYHTCSLIRSPLLFSRLLFSLFLFLASPVLGGGRQPQPHVSRGELDVHDAVLAVGQARHRHPARHSPRQPAGAASSLAPGGGLAVLLLGGREEPGKEGRFGRAPNAARRTAVNNNNKQYSST